jgi:hypothetical protein
MCTLTCNLANWGWKPLSKGERHLGLVRGKKYLIPLSERWDFRLVTSSESSPNSTVMTRILSVAGNTGNVASTSEQPHQEVRLAST